jgi:hypothetical protein
VQFGNGADAKYDQKTAATLATAVTQIVAASPAVIDAPAGSAPATADVQQATTAAINAIAPIIAPKLSADILAALGPVVSAAIIKSPDVIAAPAGNPLDINAVSKISNDVTSNIPSLLKAPETVVTPTSSVTDVTSNGVISNPTISTTDSTSTGPMTPYRELTAAERAAMTPEEQVAYLKAARDEADAAAAKARAATDPMFNFAIRPEAPKKDGVIQYYSWIGDTNSGSWKLYSAPDTPENAAKYGGRSVGGTTQATPGNPVGANTVIPTSTNPTGPTGPTTPAGPTGPATSTPTGPTGPTGFTTPTPTGTSTGTDTTGNSARQSAFDALYNEFNKYGLGSMVNEIKGLITDSNVNPSQFSLALQNTDAYKQRFAANQERIKAGLTALTPAEYIGLEDQYQNIMRNYGLPASYYTKDSLGTQAGFNKFIANDVSATELENRIATAQQRVVNSNPEVLQALKQFYPDINNADILAYTLDPQNGLDQINRKVTAAEIGGAALAQGLQANGGTAESLAGLGVTKAQAQQGYANVAEMVPRGSQLADIYKQQPYNQATAESEVFNTAGSAAAAAKRKKLTGLETASFSGSSGVGSLNRDRAVSNYMLGQPGAGSY